MNIILNNTPEKIDAENLSVNELIRYKNFTFRLLVTKVNDRLVRTDERDNVIVNEGDNVQILHLISGG
ncbi:MAG: sulfur carrier protein ThiS [Bacteroidales bacterium]|nr:sulfur carrier protein ThiS [Bacteroidales bacterium]